MKKRSYIKLTLLMVLLVLSLTACMPGDGSYTYYKPAGFFSGVWHGWIAPLSLVVRFFNPNRSMFEVVNTGFTYELGFYMAIISGFGGLSFARKNKDK